MFNLKTQFEYLTMVFFKHCRNFEIYALLFVLRLSSVYAIQTAFVPDEYWQSLEVAHNMSFGYGYLTWEWRAKIRSCIYPFMFHILYSIFPESFATFVILPKLFQATLSSIGDFFIYKLSCKLFGSECGRWTLFNLMTSWFLYYCGPRTISNMAETSFTACGLYFYPWFKGKHDKWLTCNYLWFAGASVLMRPTAVVFWFPLYVYHLWRENFFYVLKHTIFIGSINLGFLLLCDRWFYESWVFTPYKFFQLNWTQDVGSFYGEHPFLWYFYAGLPAILGIHIIPFILGLKLKRVRPFVLLIFWFTIAFSVFKHKEFRFLLPILPLTSIICGVAMNEISCERMTVLGCKVNRNWIVVMTYAILLTNFPMIAYMGFFHQRGTVDAALYLSKAVDHNSNVLFLMPCHSTPYYSYIHRNIPMNFLTCNPNFDNDPNYSDEADTFFINPKLSLGLMYNFHNGTNLPSHIVMFDSLYKHISELLDYNYQLCHETFYTHFPETRTGKYVRIYCNNRSLYFRFVIH